MKVERAARDLINLLISSLDGEIVLESAAVSGRVSPATTIIVRKREEVAELDLKPGVYSKPLGILYIIRMSPLQVSLQS